MKLRKLPSRSRTSKTSSSCSGVRKIKKRSVSKCKKCVCMPHKVGPVEFPPVWTELRKNEQLCDGTVRCQDSREFKIHRAILSVVSPYFKVPINFSNVPFSYFQQNNFKIGISRRCLPIPLIEDNRRQKKPMSIFQGTFFNCFSISLTLELAW